MRFTPMEWEIIDHRLGVPDAIAEALEEDFPGVHPDTIMDRCYAICMCGCVPDDLDDKLSRYIIWDCVDGSTFMDGVDDAYPDELTQQKVAAYRRAMNSLERKVEGIK